MTTPTPTPANAREVIERMIRGYEVAAEMGLDDPDEREELATLRTALAAMVAQPNGPEYMEGGKLRHDPEPPAPMSQAERDAAYAKCLEQLKEAERDLRKPDAPAGEWRKRASVVEDEIATGKLTTAAQVFTRMRTIMQSEFAAAPQQAEGVTEEMVHRACDAYDAYQGTSEPNYGADYSAMNRAITAALSSALEGRGKG